MRYLVTLAYDGTNYNGYQRQPGLKTIQGELEKALQKINNHNKVEVHSSGRTDAGVHALNQKAHFDIDINITIEKLKKALNSSTSSDIYIRKVEIVNDNFHARYNVKAKGYIYKLNLGEYNPMERNSVYQYNKQLDIKAMKKAIKYLVGNHDFRAFANHEEVKENCVREIKKASIKKEKELITLNFLATGFLKYQVRNMVGTIIEVGQGKKQSEEVKLILQSKDRKKAGPKAPPEGLYLSDVIY